MNSLLFSEMPTVIRRKVTYYTDTCEHQPQKTELLDLVSGRKSIIHSLLYYKSLDVIVSLCDEGDSSELVEWITDSLDHEPIRGNWGVVNTRYNEAINNDTFNKLAAILKAYGGKLTVQVWIFLCLIRMPHILIKSIFFRNGIDKECFLFFMGVDTDDLHKQYRAAVASKVGVPNGIDVMSGLIKKHHTRLSRYDWYREAMKEFRWHHLTNGRI